MRNNAILIDSMNVKTFFYCISNRKSKILILFAPLSLIQKVSVHILILIGCDIDFQKININLLPKNYKRTYDDTTLVVLRLYEETISYLSKYDLAMGFIFRNEIVNRIHDSITIYNYIYYSVSLDKEVDRIYIGNNNCEMNSDYFDKKTFFYKVSRQKKMDHENILNKSENYSVFMCALSLFKMFNIRLKNNKIFAQGLYYGHGTLGIKAGELLGYINNLIDQKYNVLFLTNKSYYRKGVKVGNLNELSVKMIAHYFYNIFHFINYIKTPNNISFNVLITLIYHWISSVQMRILIKNLNCKFVYSDYESYHMHCLHSQCRKIPGVKSYSHSNSLGYFPELRFYRCSEYFFVWGSFQQKIYEKSRIDVKNIIQLGYQNETRAQFNKGQSIRDKYIKDFKGIITVYDTPGQCIGCSEEDIIDLLLITMKIAQELNFFVIIKPKKILTVSIRNSISKFKNNFSIIDENIRGSLSPGFASDLVVGYGLASTPNILATFGKKIVLYEPYDNLWDMYPYYENKHRIISRSLKSFEENIYYWINYHSDTSDFSFVDPYADHEGSNRIIEFIDSHL